MHPLPIPPNPREQAVQVLAELHKHALRTDTELAAFLADRHAALTRVIRQGLLATACLAALAAATVWRLADPGRVEWVVLGIVVPAFVGMMGMNRLDPKRRERSSVCLVRRSLAAGLFEGYGFELSRVFGSPRSQAPIDDFGRWSWLTKDAASHPELAVVWAGWLLSGKPLREADCQRMHEAVEAFQKAKKWEVEQTARQSQADFRAVALNELPAEAVSHARALASRQHATQLNAQLPGMSIPADPAPRL